MSKLEHIALTPEQLEDLPVFFSKLFSNRITNSAQEIKLCKYDPKLQDVVMRDAYPPKYISKIYIPKIHKRSKP